MTSEWKKCRLGDLVTFTSGGTPSKQKAEYWNGNIPWISAKAMKNERISTSNLMISEDGLNNGSRLAPKGSILFLIRGSGLFNGIPICLVEQPVAFNQDVKCIESCSEIENKYIFYWLLAQSSKLSAMVGVTTIGAGKFDMDVIKNLEISYPPAQIRKEIIKISDAISEKIRLNVAINDNLEQQAQAIFKAWFVDTPNEDRKICRADEYFDISIGKTPPRKEHQWFTNSPNDIIWVSISDMGDCGTFIENSSEHLTEEAVKKFNIKVVPTNTVILSFKLTVGRVAITANDITTNEAIAHFKAKNQDITEYLYCYLKQFNYQSLGSTSSIAVAVNSKIIKSMPFVIPTDKEISDFHNLVYPMFREILKNQQENQRLANLRDTLLPKLMNGEIDVSAVKI